MKLLKKDLGLVFNWNPLHLQKSLLTLKIVQLAMRCIQGLKCGWTFMDGVLAFIFKSQRRPATYLDSRVWTSDERPGLFLHLRQWANKLSDLIDIYISQLNCIFPTPSRQRPHTTLFKERLLCNLPELTADNHGKEVLLTYKENVGLTLDQANNADTDAIH
jgi:hypothetical protein